MSKRSAAEKIHYYTEKIKKLEKKKAVKKRRRVVVYSSSSDKEDFSDNGEHRNRELDNASLESPRRPPLPTPSSPLPMLPSPNAPPARLPSPPPAAPPQDLPNEVVPLGPEINKELLPELDPELLQALGDPADDVPIYGPEIHSTLAQRWLPILKKGIQHDAKDKLLKEYAIPENCKLLKAPTLNAEISAAVGDIVRARDKKMQTKQDQLGLGITAINKAMTLLLTGDNKVQAVKILSDGCRILSDLHFVETQVRKKLITPGLEKSFLTVIQDEDRDESLFGVKLTDKIKASKAIEKQGHQIRKPSTPKPSTSNESFSSTRPRNQGNWSGPPRNYSSNRGGRRSSYRTSTWRGPPAAPPPPPQPPLHAATSPANKRAQTRQ